MKQRSKKIIAREFLFLLGTSIFYFLLLFIWSSIKDSNQLKQLEIKNNIEQLTSYEKLPYRLRTFYYINNDIIKNHYNKMTDSKKFISVIKDYDEAEKIYVYIKEKGTIGIDKSEFFKRITEDKESENYLTKILPLEKELSKLESSFFNDLDDDKALALLTILVAVFFFLRYLIYATQWSIKQLKQ